MKVWEASTGREVQSLPHPFSAQGVAFSPGSRRLASSSGGEGVRIWDPATGQELLRFGEKIPSRRGSWVAFSPDGSRVTSTHDGDVRVWDAATGQQIEVIRGRLNQIHCLAFSPDGLQLAAGGGYAGKGEARVWPVRLGQGTKE